MKFRELADITLPDPDIDKNVANLVKALTAIKLQTVASCEGHLDDERHGHPWVGFNPFSVAKVAALQILIGKYNLHTSRVSWQADNGWLRPVATGDGLCICSDGGFSIRSNITSFKLQKMQDDGEDLSKFIFDHRQDSSIIRLLSVRGY